MSEEFRLEGGSGELGPRLGSELGCLDWFAGADELNSLLEEQRCAGVLACPRGLEIVVYPRGRGA